jgi:hypothetical protein
MSLVTIKTFTDPMEANICKAQLEGEGIQCWLKNETAIAANPLMGNALGGYQLQCSDVDAERAAKLLQ